jgi:endonuclease/exonuclease/phosphatase family metal-dependent hydrolase
MKILTLNTWQKRGPWKERWEVILQGLSDFRPDCVGFQELFDLDWAEEIRRRSGYPYLVSGEEKAGSVFLSKFPVSGSDCLVMKTQSPTEDYRRYALYAELDVRGQKVAFFNTHLSWKPGESAVRQRQTAELLDFMDAKAGGCETAVMGDFNAAPGTPEIEMMSVKGRFIDAYRSANPGSAGITWDNAHPYVQMASEVLPDRRIDYFFYRNAGKILGPPRSVKRVYQAPDSSGIYATDHYGVLAEFQTTA